MTRAARNKIVRLDNVRSRAEWAKKIAGESWLA